MSRRAKSTKKRSTKTTVLVVTNGEVTELRYLEWLRDKVNGPHEKYSVTVKDIPGDPLRVLSKVPTKNYDQVWLVVDQDDHSSKKMQSFIKDCQRENIAAVVSVPCFEVWLNAHYARVKTTKTRRKHNGTIVSYRESRRKMRKLFLKIFLMTITSRHVLMLIWQENIRIPDRMC